MPRGKPVSRKELLENLRELADELGRTPTTLEVKHKTNLSQSAYYNKYDSFNDALREAGLEPRREHNIPKFNLLNEIERLATGDKPPTAREMDKRGNYAASTLISRFGKWNKAVEAAGYEPNQQKDAEGVDRRDYSYSKYNARWKELSYKIREIDGECLDCGRTQNDLERYGQRLNVHHVSECDKESPVEFEGEGPSEYVTLCWECHLKWEHVGVGPDLRRDVSLGKQIRESDHRVVIEVDD